MDDDRSRELDQQLEEAGVFAPTKGNWWKRWHPRYEQVCPIDKCCFGYNQWFKWREVDPDSVPWLREEPF